MKSKRTRYNPKNLPLFAHAGIRGTMNRKQVRVKQKKPHYPLAGPTWDW